MRIDIITVLPELLKSPFEASILKRAIEKKLVSIHFHNIRDFSTNSYNNWIFIHLAVPDLSVNRYW